MADVLNAPAEETKPQAEPADGRSELSLLAGWYAGAAVVFLCGWGLLYAGYYLAQRYNLSLWVTIGPAALLSLGLFVLLERGHRLSRLMGLKYRPQSPWLLSAGGLWAFGLVGLLFRPTVPATHHRAAGEPEVAPSETPGREIVETVVFVVVLVLMLKSFAAEAFIIPTGSMGETLYGHQKIVVCPECTQKFPVNCSDEVDPQEGRSRQDVVGCTCPNCERNIRLARGRAPAPGVLTGSRATNLPGRQTEQVEYVEVADPGASSGDRVLVIKAVYDRSFPGLPAPDRLDVVVFKYPEGPQKNYVAMNYIKRLIGLPGETIGIYGGDLYVLSPKLSPKHDDSDSDPLDRWKPRYMHQKTNDAVEGWDKFEIVRKPPKVLLEMMRPVFDNDKLPADLLKSGRYVPRWKSETEGAWVPLREGRAFRFGGGEKTDWLRYRHAHRDGGGKPGMITDFMAYNSGEAGQWDGRQWANVALTTPANGTNWVGDLVVECEVDVEQAEGEVALELVRCGEKFRATWDLGSKDGTCTLTRESGGKTTTLGSAPTRVGKGSYKLRFANVDRRLTVWVNNTDLPFKDGIDYASDRVVPTEDDRQPVSIGVKGTKVTVDKIKVFRDSYHALEAGTSDLEGIDWTAKGGWDEKFSRLGKKTLYVQPDHYLCLGDNSLASSDGRTWGLVPHRLMLGKAVAIYFPFTRTGRIR